MEESEKSTNENRSSAIGSRGSSLDGPSTLAAFNGSDGDEFNFDDATIVDKEDGGSRNQLREEQSQGQEDDFLTAMATTGNSQQKRRKHRRRSAIRRMSSGDEELRRKIFELTTNIERGDDDWGGGGEEEEEMFTSFGLDDGEEAGGGSTFPIWSQPPPMTAISAADEATGREEAARRAAAAAKESYRLAKARENDEFHRDSSAEVLGGVGGRQSADFSSMAWPAAGMDDGASFRHWVFSKKGQFSSDTTYNAEFAQHPMLLQKPVRAKGPQENFIVGGHSGIPLECRTTNRDTFRAHNNTEWRLLDRTLNCSAKRALGSLHRAKPRSGHFYFPCTLARWS